MVAQKGNGWNVEFQDKIGNFRDDLNAKTAKSAKEWIDSLHLKRKGAEGKETQRRREV